MDLISLALVSALTCIQPSTDKLLGFWESNTTSRGGIGNNIEFRKDGSYNSSVVVLVDLAYVVINGKIYISPSKGAPINNDQGIKIEINDQSLTLIGENGEKVVKNRIKTSNSESIVGQYKYRHYTGAIAYELYTNDGLLKLRIPMSADGGCYSIENNIVNMTKENEEPKRMEFSLSPGMLSLKSPNNSYSYNLVDEGAWYKSDEIDYKKPIQ